MKDTFSLLFFVTICWVELGTIQGFHRHGVPSAFHEMLRTKRSVAVCDPDAKYRRIDGQCNNLDHPLWGSASIPLDRLVENAYEDNVQTPRVTAISGSPLPSAREISLKIHKRDDVEDHGATIMVMHWGQFIDHDISLTPKGDENLCPCDDTSLECLAIPLSNDEFFRPRECLEFKRSNWQMAADDIHQTPIRQQLNALTAYIDASTVYGSSEEELAALRFNNGHELKVFTSEDGDDFMPPDPTAKPCRPNRGSFCHKAGDGRSNVQPALGALHTLFVREHNRIANMFKSSTSWDDEKIFQETRKIIGAMMQVINYKEYLPLVLGPTYMKKFDLDVSSYLYDATLRPDVFNSFATSAFRFGHSQIPENLDLSCGRSLAFKDVWLKPAHARLSYDELFTAGATQLSTATDQFLGHSVTRHLFEISNKKGSDLAALNIQRARDHGLPSYNEYREYCGFNKLTSLDQLFPNDPDAAAVYESIDDVDLFVGGLAESPLPGALVGKTFACLLGIQFKKLKSADRFFYLNTQDRAVRFSAAQRNELNRVKLSKVVCANSDVRTIQKKMFIPVNPSTNQLRECSSLKPIDLTPWTSS